MRPRSSAQPSSLSLSTSLRPDRLLLVDHLPSPSSDKSLLEWGQNAEAAEPVIEALTKPKELIIDPTAGTESGHIGNLNPKSQIGGARK